MSPETSLKPHQDHIKHTVEIQTASTIPRKPIPSPATSMEGNQYGIERSLDESRLSSKEPEKSSSLLGIWRLEILCCVLFVVALLAIIATVHPYEGLRPPDWRYGLSLNTLIAIYAVILKAAMLLVSAQGLSQLKWHWFEQGHPLKDFGIYDDASRGPWGSLLLLRRLGGRHVVSSCGAIITIAALLIDPFAQQVISTYECMVPNIAQATLARSNFFNETSYGGATGSTASIGMQAAINQGIFGPGAPVSYRCITGNCTFPTLYHSLGFCSNCLDMTYNLTIQNLTSLDTNPSFGTVWNITLPPFAGPEPSAYTLLNGSATWPPSLFDVFSDGVDSDIVLGFTSHQVASKPCAKDCKTINNCHGNLTWGCGGLGSTSLSTALSTGIGAARCTLFPCVRTYNGTVSNGELLEDLVSVATIWNPLDWEILNGAMIDTACLSETERDALTNAGYWIGNETFIPANSQVPEAGFTAINYNVSFNSSDQRTLTVPSDCLYGISTTAQQNIEEFVATYLTGNVSMWDSELWDLIGPSQLQAIYNNQDITFLRVNETFRNISDSITKYMREYQAGTGYNKAVVGETYQAQACVHIKWAFITYPAVIVILAIAFFVGMMLETNLNESHGRDWKSSPLALLFHGLDQAALNWASQRRSLIRTKDMNQAAANISVRLSQSERGWNLVPSNELDADPQARAKAYSSVHGGDEYEMRP